MYQIAADDYLSIVGIDGKLDIFVLGQIVIAFLEQPAENIDFSFAIHLQHPILTHYPDL